MRELSTLSLILASLLLCGVSASKDLLVLGEDGAAVRGALVVTESTSYITDSLGLALLPEDAVVLKVNALGYLEWSGRYPSDGMVALTPSAVPSGVVIPVRATRSASMRDRTPSTSVLSARLLGVSPEGAAHRLNSRVPGLFARGYGGGMTVLSISLRGAEAGQTGLSLNGHRLQSARDGLGPGELDLGLFGAMEIARGGAASQVPGAISGTINLRSLRPSAPDRLELWGSSEGTAGARTGLGLDSGRLAVSIRRLQGTPSGYAAAALGSVYSQGWRCGTLLHSAQGVTEAPTWSPESGGWRERTGLLAWADGSCGTLPLEISLDFRGERMTYSASGQGAERDTHTDGSLAGTLTWRGCSWFSLGGGMTIDGVSSTALGSHQRAAAHTIVGLGWKPGELSMSLEARGQGSSEGGPEGGFSLSASSPLLEQWLRIYGSLARSFRRPTYNDLYWPEDAFAQGNPQLRPERAWEGELGVAASASGLGITVCGYLSSTRDQIAWLPDASGIWSPENVSRVRRMGLEIQSGFREGTLSLDGGMTIGSSVDRTPGAASFDCRMPYRPDIVGGLEASLMLPGLTLRTNISGRSLVYKNRTQTDYIPGYWLLGAGASLPLTRRLELHLDAGNLLGREYEVTDGYPGEGENVSLLLRWEGGEQ